MSQYVKAEGQLRHCFFGEYSAVIALIFADDKSAKDAQNVLGKKWKSGKNSEALIWDGNSSELEEMTKILVGYGAEENKIASLKYSIDYGEKFFVSIPIVPKEQIKLFE